jgi:hypothetical protein
MAFPVVPLLNLFASAVLVEADAIDSACRIRGWRYGAKGIAVCDEWRDSPGAFYEWALANGYRDDLQIDHKENLLGYSAENCRWRTQGEQQNNRENNTRLEWDGETLTHAEWSRRTGINRNNLSARHHKGWSAGEVLGFVKNASSRKCRPRTIP